MGALPCLREQNEIADTERYGIKKLSSLLPEVQTGNLVGYRRVAVSMKSKKKLYKLPEEWEVVPDTHVFLAILRDIKKDMDNGEQPGEAVTAAMFQTMQDALVEQKQTPLTIDDVTKMVAGQIGQLVPMDEETSNQFRRLMKKIMEQTDKEIKVK